MFFKSLAPSKINNTENFKIPPQLFRNVLGAFRTRIKCFSSPGDVKDRSRAEVTQGKEGKEKGLLHVREVSQGAERIQTEMLTTPVVCSHNGAVHRCHAEGKGLISAFSHEGLRWEGGHLKRDSHIKSLGGEDSFFFLIIKSNLGVCLEWHHDSISYGWESSRGALEREEWSIKSAARKRGWRREMSRNWERSCGWESLLERLVMTPKERGTWKEGKN